MKNIKFREKVLSFLMDIRVNNTFNDEEFEIIKDELTNFVYEYENDDKISKDILLPCMYLSSELAIGNEDMSKEEQIKLEDASIEVEFILSKLDK